MARTIRLSFSFKRALATLSHIGADPNDEDNVRLQKSLLVICSFPFMLAGLIWGIMYFIFQSHKL